MIYFVCRLLGVPTPSQIKKARLERATEALTTEDYEWVKENLLNPKEEAEVALMPFLVERAYHKARVEFVSLPRHYRRESFRWLRRNGFRYQGKDIDAEGPLPGDPSYAPPDQCRYVETASGDMYLINPSYKPHERGHCTRINAESALDDGEGIEF